MPKLEEGNFWIRATLPDVDLARAVARSTSAGCARILRGCPTDGSAVRRRRTASTPRCSTVVSQLGRPDDGTDVAGFYNIELFAPLEPFDEWPRGLTKEKLTDELDQRARARRSPASSSTSRR